MTTRGFGMDCFGRGHFDNDARKRFKEEWSKMTDSEKLEFMNKKMEHLDHDHFSVEAIDARCEQWMNMSTAEKEAFVKERKEAFEGRMQHGMGGFFGRMHR